jgi:hypothetical protein
MPSLCLPPSVWDRVAGCVLEQANGDYRKLVALKKVSWELDMAVERCTENAWAVIEDLAQVAQFQNQHLLRAKVVALRVDGDVADAMHRAFPRLTHVHLIGCTTSQQVLARLLFRYPQLQSLSLRQCSGIYNDALELLPPLRNLVSLDISGTMLSAHALANLPEQLQSLQMRLMLLMNASDVTSYLMRLTHLTHLDLCDNDWVEGKLLRCLPPRIRHLNLLNCPQLTVRDIPINTEISIKHDCKLLDDSEESIRVYLMAMIGANPIN